MLCFVTILINAQNNLESLHKELNYEKSIFEHSNNSDSLNKYLFEKAFYFKDQKKYKKAILTLQRINENDLLDSNKYNLYYQLAILNYITNNYNEVDLYVNKIKYFISDSSFQNKLVLLEILNLNNLQRWSEGKTLLISQLKNKNDSNLINDWYKEVLSLKLKKIKTAQTLQTFSPGIGHIYIGKTMHGIVNAGLILSGLTWGAYNFYNEYYVTGVFTGFLISYVFYTGGIAYAIDNVDKYNTKRIKLLNNNLNNKIINLLQP